MAVNLNFDDYFDGNGNMTELEHIADIKWNYRDNIAQATIIERENAPDDAEYYVYDSSGNRVRKVKEAYKGNGAIEIEETIYLGGVEIKRIRTENNSSKTEKLERSDLHVMDDTNRIAIVNYWAMDENNHEINSQSELNQNKIRCQYENHLSSASIELDSSGKLISYEEYFPYGGTSFIAGTNQAEVNLKEYRYSGKERDDTTGLYYNGARYYAPWLGRWLSCDPVIDEESGFNLYRFCSNNPLKFIDPDGMAEIPTSFDYTVNKGDSYWTLARYIMQNSGRPWITEQEQTNDKLVKELADSIQQNLASKNITSLSPGQQFELGDVGYYLSRLSVNKKKQTTIVKRNDTNISNESTKKVATNLFTDEDLSIYKVPDKVKYFVLHQAGDSGTESESYIKNIKNTEQGHGYIMNDGELIEVVSFNKSALATKLEKYKNKSLIGKMIHIEQIYKTGVGPSEAQYQKVAEIYAKIYYATGKRLIIVAHREVDRGITVPDAGHNDPKDYDFNKLYNILKDMYGINVTPGVEGITQERYQIPNQYDQVPNYSGPILKGPVIRH